MGSGGATENVRSRWDDWLRRRCRWLAQRPMLIVFLLSLIGMGLGTLFPSPFGWLWITLLMVATWFLLAIRSRSAQLTTIVLMSIPPLVAWRQQAMEHELDTDRLHALADDQWQPVVVEGIVESTPRWRPDLIQMRDSPADEELTDDRLWETLIELRVTRIRDGDRWWQAEFGKMQIAFKERLRTLIPGDRVRCWIEWQRIGGPTNPGQYDPRVRYRRSGILVRGRSKGGTPFEELSGGERWRLDRLLGRMVVAADQAFHRHVSYRQANLASALVLGQREQVEWELQESLLATGTIHMLAISGMHIEMVAASILVCCRIVRLPRRPTILVTIMTVIAYSLLCGGNPPVARAAILVVTLGIAQWIGKTTNSLNLLGLAAVAVLLNRPTHWFEVGTQLSFLAVALLILLPRNHEPGDHDPIDRLWEGGSHPIFAIARAARSKVTELLATSFWVWAITAPLVMFHFHVVSPIAVLLNLVLWIPLLLALLSGLGLLALGSWSAWLGGPLGWFCGLQLELTDRIVRRAELIPGSHGWFSSPSPGWVISYYLTVGAILAIFGLGRRPRWAIAAVTGGWFAIAVLPGFSSSSQHTSSAPSELGERQTVPRLQVTFIDVGHGTSVLIRTPANDIWLYDAGRLGNAQYSYRNIADVLWYERIRTIDRLILSHADADHFNAIPGIAKRFGIRAFLHHPQILEHSNPGLQKTLEDLRGFRIPFQSVAAGDSFASGETIGTILHPGPAGVEGTDNANSLCLLITYRGFRLLLPGDLEGRGLEAIVGQPPQRGQVLMAPHHGSLSDDVTPLLDWFRPQAVVVSGGTRARSPAVQARYAAPDRQVFNTALHHAVRATITPTGEISWERWEYPGWIETK